MTATVTAPNPNDQHQAVQRAEALLNQGHADEAERLLAGLLQANPASVQAQMLRGGALMQLGRHAEALTCFQAMAARAPRDPRGDHNCGVALMALGRFNEALARFDRALAADPDFTSAHYNKGATFSNMGRLREAVACYDQVLARDPANVEAWNNRGVVLQTLGELGPALDNIRRATELKPNDPAMLNNLSNLLRMLGRNQEALQACDRALAVAPDYPAALNNRGVALGALGRLEEALAAFDRAVQIRPEYPEAQENRGVMLTELGRPDEAAQAFDEAVRVAPRRIRGYYDLTETRKMTPGDPRIAAMEALAGELASFSAVDQVELTFSLGKTYADLGDHERAFQRLSQGGALKRALVGYDEAGSLEGMRRTAQAFTGEVLWRNAGKGDPSTLPVFILGMPRSGSTLIEQIIASHPEVYAAGESDAFRAAMVAMVSDHGTVDTPEGFARLGGAGLRRLGAEYLSRVTPRAGGAQRITDKSIEAFRFAGLIHMALPNTRFIHIKRDPLDTCVSCFTKLFVSDLPYTYDLAELGRYYVAYEALMAHWMKVLPEGSIIEVRYEDLVADLEGQSRRVLAHCGLAWDPAVLDFHQNQRAIRTASFAQVRRPIYTSSIGRWRVYEPWLGPLQEALGLP